VHRRRHPLTSLFQPDHLVSATKAERLQQTWAEAFWTRVLPLIDEDRRRGRTLAREAGPGQPEGLARCGLTGETADALAT
jgi:hypothetical protein